MSLLGDPRHGWLMHARYMEMAALRVHHVRTYGPNTSENTSVHPGFCAVYSKTYTLRNYSKICRYIQIEKKKKRNVDLVNNSMIQHKAG